MYLYNVCSCINIGPDTAAAECYTVKSVWRCKMSFT